jgi:DNA-binding NtrC family response regulator
VQRTAAPTQLIERNGRTVARRLQKIRVTVLDGPDKGVSFEGAQDEVRIGGSEENDVLLHDPSVSRRHAAIRLTADGLRVTDLGSTNGTFMGDVRIHDVVLQGTQELYIGATRVRVEPLAQSVEKDVSAGVRFGRLVGTSVAMREVFAVLERIASSDLTVLVEGETGTGKELVADAIHRNSPRAGGAFIAVDCGATPKDAIEAELFGSDKPGPTGRPRQGALSAAEGGTLFLDEVAELPLEAQGKFLRVLESREYRALGAEKPSTADVRVVVATSRNLPREVKEGRFRQDLYYRLSAVVVKLPPLRSRLEDVPVLVETILEDINRRRTAQGVPPYPSLDRRAMELLSHYDFPGNVRELRNLVERFAVLGADPSALAQSTPDARDGGGFEIRTELPFHDAKEIWTDIFEKTYLTKLLQVHNNNVSAAARTSGIDRRHLQRLMVKHDLRDRERSQTGTHPVFTDPADPPTGSNDPSQ